VVQTHVKAVSIVTTIAEKCPYPLTQMSIVLPDFATNRISQMSIRKDSLRGSAFSHSAYFSSIAEDTYARANYFFLARG